MTESADLCARLGFTASRPNRAQFGMQRLGMTKAGSWVFQRTLYRIDRPLYRWSRGRITVPGTATGLPVILLTTTGAKSGVARTMPVAGIPDRDVDPRNLYVMGTNFAQAKSPAWAINLSAEPRCEVTWRDRTCAACAVPVTDPDEREHAWRQAASYYLGFTAYRERIQNRDVKIFRLTLSRGLDDCRS
jgi:deazaflavin-dependent oxidoreductase (nitroreductase family)